MRVLFAVFPSAAHLHPVVPLARALQSAGHEVRVAMHPDMAGTVTATGLTVLPVGTPDDLRPVVDLSRHPERLDRLTANLALDTEAPGDWREKWRQVCNVLSLYPAVLDDLVALARGWRPDLVVWDTFCLPGAIAAHLTGATHVRYLWGQDNIGWLRQRSRAAPDADDPLPALMEPLLAPYGLDFREEFLLGQFTLDLMPPGMALPLDVRRIPVRRVPYNGVGPRPAWLRERPDRPRVCFTLGLGGRGRQFFRETGVALPDLLDAVADLDVELVATLDDGQVAELPAIPPHVRTSGYVPLDQVLPTCAAVVHHGGGGTFATAVAHEVPQLVVPLPFWAELATARHVRRRGAGILRSTAEFTPCTFREDLRRLLHEETFRRGAAALHEESLTSPAPGDVVPVLERLATRPAHA
ncbi:nucleotide disphospho-sugar-binding domain-containing protein [Streptomyces sp. CRN 30]|uniref:nucleotide disphospho-sugar-binding domain-containing protein n=1 Tax=Streptomyces sp. CRN 30 TaxID=3075613 RepID=UPI002A830226|nr:nucleotide disphospho-sugar-binding domain-containing protein [Streptomyces sp. CRN 30]